MNFKITPFDKKNVFIEVNNGLNLKMTFCNFGASVYSIYYDNEPLNLIIKDKEQFLKSNQFYGKTLGPVAGRMLCDGQINGEEYHLTETNEGTNFSLHGGFMNSLSFKTWKYSVKDNKNEIRVIFSYKEKDGFNGFPGSSSIKVIYSLSKTKNSFKINFVGSAKTPAFLNLSNHIYWNFANSRDLNDYYLKMNANTYGYLRDDLLIIGVDDVPPFLDFQRSKKIKGSADFIKKNLPIGTIDNTFLFDGKKGNACLKNKEYTLKLVTDLPAMNIYLDSSMTPVIFLNRNDFVERRGIALEPQLFTFDTDSMKLLPGQKYNHKIIYTIKKNK
jgi:galactose mutarotase-like enzyme